MQVGGADYQREPVDITPARGREQQDRDNRDADEQPPSHLLKAMASEMPDTPALGHQFLRDRAGKPATATSELATHPGLAGEACLGIGSIVISAMQREGLSEAEAKQRCLFIDSKG